MEMHQVRYFLAAAEDVSFTKAAEHCGVSQPTMTRAIKLLETELGGLLFHRDRAPVTLTELGRMVLPYMQQIVAQAAEAKQRALALSQPHRSALRIGIMCTIAPSRLVPLIARLREAYPEIDLQVADATAFELAEQLDAGQHEVCIMCHPNGEHEHHHSIPLYRERFVIAVGSGQALSEKAAIRASDLGGASYLDRIACEYGDIASRMFAERGVVDRTVYRSDRDDWIMAMAAAGLGYAFVPEHSVSHPGVVALPLVDPEITREICLVTVRGRRHPTPLGALVREAMRLFPRPPGEPHAAGVSSGGG